MIFPKWTNWLPLALGAVAVLAGGETIIRRKGEPGLVRRGPGTGLTPNGAPDTKNLATVSEEVKP